MSYAPGINVVYVAFSQRILPGTLGVLQRADVEGVTVAWPDIKATIRHPSVKCIRAQRKQDPSITRGFYVAASKEMMDGEVRTLVISKFMRSEDHATTVCEYLGSVEARRHTLKDAHILSFSQELEQSSLAKAQAEFFSGIYGVSPHFDVIKEGEEVTYTGEYWRDIRGMNGTVISSVTENGSYIVHFPGIGKRRCNWKKLARASAATFKGCAESRPANRILLLG